MTKLGIDRVHGGAAGDLLDFSASVNPLGPPPEAIEAYLDAAQRIVRYPDPEASKLRDALARRHSVSPESILVAAGSTAVFHLFAEVIAPERPAVVIPTFSEIANASLLRGRHVSPLVLDAACSFAWPRAEIAATLRRGCDALFFGRPNSPTGSFVRRDDAREIAEQCARHGARCVIDEAFIDFVGEEESLASVAAETEGLLVVRSLTKVFAIPGLRVGYAVAHPPLVDRLRSRRMPWSISTPAEEVAVACLGAPRAYVDRMLATVAEGRAQLISGLTRAGLTVFPSAANFVLVFDPSEADPEKSLQAKLARHGLAVRDLAALPGLSPGFLRIAVRSPEDNEKLLRALSDAA
ncbi:MAG: threonine-phosphate decarboxylase [Candidatus Binatota bacterium]|nr:threonine-phosphate decarboxylase [Candidatus Binatota bacterium]